MLNKVHFDGESEILDYEYGYEDYHTSEDDFTSARSEHIINGGTNDELVLMLRYEKSKVSATDEEEFLNNKILKLSQSYFGIKVLQ